MNSKDLVLRSLRCQPVSRPPWVPFAGVHAASLCGYSATEYLQDPGKMTQAVLAANRQYQPDGLPVAFDLQLEAEILGCDLLWAEKSPPTVATHPLAGSKTLPQTVPDASAGRLPIVLETTRRVRSSLRDTALFGLVCGPLTLASHLRGTDLFMDTYDDPSFVDGLLRFCADFSRQVSCYYREAGADVIAWVDPLVSQISPEHFSRFLEPLFAEIFAELRRVGAASSFFVCGDATRNIEGMCRTQPDSIFIDENIDIAAAQQTTARYNVALGGNIPLSTVMLLGTQQDNMQYVLDQLEKLDPCGHLVAPGCDMPYDTPPENVIGILQALHEPDRVRRMLAGYRQAAPQTEVELPDYDALKRPLIEVVTLDSASCPACTYMMNAVRAIERHYGGAIDVAEYKIVEAENIPRVARMGIKNLPAIVINGTLAFSSLIPSQRQLLQRLAPLLEASDA